MVSLDIIRELAAPRFFRIENCTYSKSGKTVVVSLLQKDEGNCLGVIAWHGAWRQYTFQPTPTSIWDAKCLEDVIKLLGVLNLAHKDKLHDWKPRLINGYDWTVCAKCGNVQNVMNKVGICRGSAPVQPREQTTGEAKKARTAHNRKAKKILRQTKGK